MNDELRECLIGGAAVRGTFDLEALSARVGCAADEAIEVLLPMIEPRVIDDAPRWALHTAHRRRVLANADRVRVEQWLGPLGERDGAQEVLRRWMAQEIATGGVIEPSDELREVCSWLVDVGWIAPSAEEVRRLLDVEELRDRLQRAVGDVFTGRSQELARLGECFAKGTSLVVDARGGMGKTALLAKALLDADAYDNRGPLVVWIDFDNPAVDVREPETIFLELARQLAVQEPALHDYQSAIQSEIDEHRRTLQSAASRGHEDELMWFLGKHVLSAPFSGRRLIVILDTFERARQASASLASRLVEELAPALAHVDAALVIAGRQLETAAETWRIARLALGPLPPDEAFACLVSLGVDDASALQIVELVRPTPLTLHLAARAVTTLGAAPFPEVELRWAIKRQLVDGVLYARVLAHLATPHLAGVARAAMLLHSITPDYLAAIVCPSVVPAVPPEEADELFHQLAAVTDLVSLPTAGVVRLRPELAAELVTLLHESDGALVRRVHERAVAYLSALETPTPTDTTELAYHLLALDRVDDAGKLAAANLDELAHFVPTMGVNAAKWLDARSIAQDARTVEDRVRALLAAKRPAEALELLDEEPQRTRPLLVLEATAALDVGDRGRAQRVVERAADLVSGPDADLEWLHWRLGLSFVTERPYARTLLAGGTAIAASYIGYPETWIGALAAFFAAFMVVYVQTILRMRRWLSARKLEQLEALFLAHPVLDARLAVNLAADSARLVTQILALPNPMPIGRRMLDRLFADPIAWQTVVDAELDLARRVLARLSDDRARPPNRNRAAALASAIDLGLFDRAGLPFAPIARVLADRDVPGYGRRSMSAWNAQLMGLANVGLAGKTLRDLLSDNDARLSNAMREVLEVPIEAAAPSRRDRAALLEELASSIMKTVPLAEWRILLAPLVDPAELERLFATPYAGLAYRRTLTLIDRKRLGPQVMKALEKRASSSLVQLGYLVWPAAASKTNQGLVL